MGEARPLGRREVVVLVAVGMAAGVLSGFFGIGGGSVIVPALVFAGFTQRQAAATSLAAIVPTAVVGVVAYLVAGNVDWIAGALIIPGVIAGARIGSYLLSKLPEKALRWAFVAFIAVIAVTQFVWAPERGAQMPMDLPRALAVLALGLVTGILSGILGLGGGVVVVPALTLLFGASDLVARGTSLLMMIPGAATGTYSNYRKRLVSLKAAALIGLPACATTPLGSFIAGWSTPKINTVMFGVYLAVLAVRSTYVALKKDKKED